MPPFLENADLVAAFLFSAGALLWIVNQWNHFRGRNAPPQPFLVEATKRFVERPEYEADKRVNDERHKAATIARKSMHQDMEDARSRLARVEEQNIAQTDKIDLLSADFREFMKEQRVATKEILNNCTRRNCHD